MSKVDDLRLEIAKVAGKIRTAYGHEDWPSFHLNVGLLAGLSMRLYEANAKEERGAIAEWDEIHTPRLPGEPECPLDHMRDNPEAPTGCHCGDDDCEYCDWVYGERENYYEEGEL